MTILNKMDYNYYKLINYPIMMVHDEWLGDLTGVNQVSFRHLRESSSTRNQLNKILRQEIQDKISGVELSDINKEGFLYQSIGKIRLLALSSALFEIQCPDYIFSRLYRETLIREIGYQNVKQLSFYWQGGQCKPEYGEERFCSELIKYGAGNLEWLFSDNPLWTIVKYLLPKSGEIKPTHINDLFLNRLNKILLPYETL
ncbi:TPA: type III secretion system domain-containing protein [Escherichia coli]